MSKEDKPEEGEETRTDTATETEGEGTEPEMTPEEAQNKYREQQDWYQNRKAIYDRRKEINAENAEDDVEPYEDLKAQQDRMNAELAGEDPDKAPLSEEEIAELEAEARGETREQEEEPEGQTTEDVEREEVAEEPEEPEYVEVKVDGQTHQVPKQEVEERGGLKAYQLERASYARMQRLAEQERELTRRQRELEAEAERRLRQGEQSQAGTPDPAQQDQAGPPSDEGARGDDAVSEANKQLVAEVQEQLYSGDPEKAQEAISKLLEAQRGSQSVNEQRLLERLTERLRQTQPAQGEHQQQPEQEREPSEIERQWAELREQQMQEARRVLSEDFPDIIENERLRNFARTEYNNMLQDPANAGRSLADIARESAQIVRREMGLRSPKERLDARRDQKRRIPQTKRTTKRRKEPESGPRPPSRKQYLDMMRRARGQAATAEDLSPRGRR